MKRLNADQKEALRQSWPVVAASVLYFLAFPSAGLWPLAFVALAPTLGLVLTAKTRKRAFWFGFLAGFLGNLGKLYFLIYTINYYGHFPFVAAVLVQFILCATLGSFWGFTFYAARRLTEEGGFPVWLAFPVSWMFLEWFLTWILTGFPWELIGHSLIGWLPMAQVADVIGGIGLSFPVAFGNVVALEIYLYARKKRENFPVAVAAVFAAMIVAMIIYGFVRMGQIDRAAASGKSVRVGMLQGNIDQNDKWQDGSRDMTISTYRSQARSVVDQGAELVIMPETALPYWQDENAPLRPLLRKFVSDAGSWVLLAAPTKIDNPDDPEWDFKHNSAVLVSPEGELSMWYNKHRLVPFGEYLPFKKASVPFVKWLRSFEALSNLRITAGFYPGEEYVTFPYPPARFGIAICYEVIYPGIVRKIVNMGSQFMVTITNDAWFGDTSAPYQHWEQVQMRAIENRRYFARSANTGISGIVDACGRTISQTGTYVAATSVGNVRALDIRSIYLRFGDVLMYLCVAVFFALIAAAAVRKRRSKGV